MDAVSEREQKILGIIETARGKRAKFRDERITMAHGAGGKATQSLIEGLLAPAFGSEALSELADAAELVVSELVTNALRHGVPVARRLASDYCVRLRLLAQAPFVMCMVTDPGSDIPVLRESGPTSESGRGLNVVECCSVRWGWHLLYDGGKVVWALLFPAG